MDNIKDLKEMMSENDYNELIEYKLQQFKNLFAEIDKRQNELNKWIKLSSLQYIEKEASEIRELKEQLIQMYADAIKEEL